MGRRVQSRELGLLLVLTEDGDLGAANLLDVDDVSEAELLSGGSALDKDASVTAQKR